ncbi:hypothetical protein AX16_004999, partial [Volvariella volvacea WC 439]
ICRLEGTMSPQARDATIKHFMNNVHVTVFLVSLKAGGVALNLTEASRVYLMDSWWNPAVEYQAMDRIHRLGQRRPVQAIKLVVEDSIESRIVQLQEKKSAMVDATLSTDDSAMGRLTPEDLGFLFRHLDALFSFVLGSLVVAESAKTARGLAEADVRDRLERGINQPLYSRERVPDDQEDFESGNSDSNLLVCMRPTDSVEAQWMSQAMTYVPVGRIEENVSLEYNHYYVFVGSWTHFSFTFEQVSVSSYKGPILDLDGGVISRDEISDMSTLPLSTILRVTTQDVQQEDLVSGVLGSSRLVE